MLVLVDNYDSFTYNLAQFLGELGAEVRVVRNDATTPEEIATWKPRQIVLSPGPCTPDKAGISLDVVRTFAGQVPILGVCLGHQAIGQAFGGRIVRAAEVMHGKTSKVFHNERSLFAGVDNPFVAARYHSLVIAPESLPPVLEVTAKTWDDQIMAVSHADYADTAAPLVGVQFHPESVATEVGKRLLRNFLGFSDGAAMGTAHAAAMADAAERATAGPRP